MTKQDSTDIKNYVSDPSLSEVERGAAFMDWMARTHPGRTAPVTYIMKAVNISKTLPREDSDQVELFKSSKIVPIRNLLFNKYKRMFKYVYGMGYRASYDWNDLIRNFFPLTKIKSAVAAGSRVISIIPRERLSKENQEIYDSYNKEIKALQGPAGRLALPPGKKEISKNR